MGKIIWSVNAVEDLRDVFDFYFNTIRNEATARKMINGIQATADKLTSNIIHQQEPGLNPEHRRIIYKHYKIIYEIEREDIYILRIFDARQDPRKLKV